LLGKVVEQDFMYQFYGSNMADTEKLIRVHFASASTFIDFSACLTDLRN